MSNLPPMLVVLELLWPCPMLGTVSRWSGRFTHHKSLLLFIPMWGGWGTSCIDFHRWVGVQPSAACTQANCEDRPYINWNWPRFSTVVSPFPISGLHTHHPSPMLWRFEKPESLLPFNLDLTENGGKRKGAALLNTTTLITDNDIQWGIHF